MLKYTKLMVTTRLKIYQYKYNLDTALNGSKNDIQWQNCKLNYAKY